jgi:hypothetical protein
MSYTIYIHDNTYTHLIVSLISVDREEIFGGMLEKGWDDRKEKTR